VLLCDGISKRFARTVALEDVTLAVATGELLGLIGPNGSGKSTLVNVVSGFYAPDSGRVLVGDEDISGTSPQHAATRGVARTFQNLRLIDDLTVLENVVLGLHPSFTRSAGTAWIAALLGLPVARRLQRDAEARATEALAVVELETLGSRKAGALPYGLKKRLELARALVGRPRVLLLDEPTAGLGAEEVDVVVKLLRERVSGIAIVLIEHRLEFVLGLCHRVAVLDAGRKISEGTPNEVASDVRVAKAYLGSEIARDIASA
jgi:ABC-type branched-subunit amino acid transport system ATPase component